MAVGNNIMNPIVYTDKATGVKQTIAPANQGGYMKAYNTYVASAEAAKNKRYKDLQGDLKANNQTTNANYDQNARQAYVQYMQRQRALPSQLQALGVNGGATESGLLNLYNNYGNIHASNEQQRAAELANNQRDFDADWRQYTDTYEADLRNQYQTAYNNQLNEYNNEITRFSSSVAQYPTTEEGYKKYEKWIENMSKSKDPLKDIKVALIRQQMATQFPEGAPKSSSGGGGSRRRGGGYSSRSNNNNNDNSAATTSSAVTTRPLDYYRSSSANRVGSRARTASSVIANIAKRIYG